METKTLDSGSLQIHTVDCHYGGVDQAVACYLLVNQSREAVFIDNGTNLSWPFLKEALDRQGVSCAEVKYAIITHIHLDHSGGSSAVLENCPNAILVAHPRAAKHAIKPERLVQSSKQVYGEEVFQKIYGDIHPIPETRVLIPKDGETLEWGEAMFQFLYTRGHADHHFCIFEKSTASIFTGDSFGICYSKFPKDSQPFAFPTCTPTDFHRDEAIRSLEIILGTGAKTAYLTHFGPIQNLHVQANLLRTSLDLFEGFRKEAKSGNWEKKEALAFLEKKIRRHFSELALQSKLNLTESDWEFLEMDIQLNAQGLLYTKYV